MSTNRQSIYDLLAMPASDSFLKVLHRYIDKVNPSSGQNYWTRPTREDIMLHFCLVNTEEKHRDYYEHWRRGELDQYFRDHPVPKSWAMGVGQVLSWVRAKTMEQEMLRAAGLSFVPDDDEVADKPAPVHFHTKTRFMPLDRRPPTRRMREKEETVTTAHGL
ncbi:hypothetical protein [Legionella sp. CNM-4043-24]|uniref:hypothetical protein n=1 Tax=Legionella sp. CNM-4043-24 TaxID=3421646 RepID=UPI00403A8B34